MKATVAAAGDYLAGACTADFTIAVRPLKVTANARSKTYGKADPKLTYKVKGLVPGDALTGALERDAGEIPGTYRIKVGTLSASDNYAMTFKGATFTIRERSVLPERPDYTLLMQMVSTGLTKLTLSWTKVPEADGSDVFFTGCSKEEPCQLLKSVDAPTRTATVRGLNPNKCYKAYVKAWKTENDEKVYIGKASPTVHALAMGCTKARCNAESVTIKKTEVTLAAGQNSVIAAKVKGVKNRTLIKHTAELRYYSTNRKVARVNADGTITAVSAGTCTIWAIANNGVRASVSVTVVSGPTQVSFREAAYSLRKGKTRNLMKQPKVSPTGVENACTWTSSDTAIATVSDAGVVKGVKAGTATITVRTANGKTATTTVTVE